MKTRLGEDDLPNLTLSGKYFEFLILKWLNNSDGSQLQFILSY